MRRERKPKMGKGTMFCIECGGLKYCAGAIQYHWERCNTHTLARQAIRYAEKRKVKNQRSRNRQAAVARLEAVK